MSIRVAVYGAVRTSIAGSGDLVFVQATVFYDEWERSYRCGKKSQRNLDLKAAED